VNQASSLNLVTNAVIVWNTVYMVDGNQLCEMGHGSQVTLGYPSSSERRSAHLPLTRSQSPAW
jgi:hypothetical protein